MNARELPKETIEVLGKRMAYVELGKGEPIVFQHGNPTSSYLWRNIMPHLEDLGRCIALDLIGMGDSDKLEDSGPERYTFAEHSRYFDAALAALGVTQNVTLVIHDWGSALGFRWAQCHPDAVKGICYMEAVVRPLAWEEFPDDAKRFFGGLRSAAGEEMVLERNLFVERMLPGAILRDLTAEEMNVYRRPYTTPGEDRRPTLTWPRQIPIDGEPADVTTIAHAYSKWLSASQVPKLFVNGDPGSLLTGALRDFCRTWPNQTEITVPGIHFLQEDSPDQIGRALRDWLSAL